MFDDAGKSDHREVFAGPGAIKLKCSQDWGDMKLCFSAPSKLDHYCMTYPNLGPYVVYGGNNVLNPFKTSENSEKPSFC